MNPVTCGNGNTPWKSRDKIMSGGLTILCINTRNFTRIFQDWRFLKTKLLIERVTRSLLPVGRKLVNHLVSFKNNRHVTSRNRLVLSFQTFALVVRTRNGFVEFLEHVRILLLRWRRPNISWNQGNECHKREEWQIDWHENYTLIHCSVLFESRDVARHFQFRVHVHFGLKSVGLRKRGWRCIDAAGQISHWIGKELWIARSQDGIFQWGETKRQWPCRSF